MVSDQHQPPAHGGADADNDAASHARDQVKTSAGFAAVRESGFILVTPLDQDSREWLKIHVDAEASWMGETLVVERCFMPQLADAIGAAGFRLDQDI